LFSQEKSAPDALFAILQLPANHGFGGKKFDNDHNNMIMKRLIILLLNVLFREASIKVERIQFPARPTCPLVKRTRTPMSDTQA
jgi:hypothetical protein